MFTTNTQSRNGLLAERRGTKVNTLAPLKEERPHGDKGNTQHHKRKRTSFIGGTDTYGLVIQGANDFSDSIGTDRNDATPPNAGDAYRGYEFPVTYSGPGNLTFKTPVRIPGILGDVAINGNLTVSGSTDAGNDVVRLRATGDDAVRKITSTASTPYANAASGLVTPVLFGGYQISDSKCFFQLRLTWGTAGVTGTDTLAIAMARAGLPKPRRTIGSDTMFSVTGTIVRASGILVGDVNDALRIDVDNSPYVADPANETWIRFAYEKHTQSETTPGIVYLTMDSILDDGGIEFCGWYFLD